MSLIGTVPTTRVIIPRSVSEYLNGRLPDFALRDPGDGRGKLALITSYAMEAMHIAAFADGIQFASVGRYRTLAAQTSMFGDRYTTRNTGRSTKLYQGIVYYLKAGKAMAASPGTSNHGRGCADDICELKDNKIIGLTDEGLTWLRDNAPQFGFGLEQRDERWHWHTRFDNVLPDRAVRVLNWCSIPFPEWMGSLPGDNPPPPVVVPDEPQPEPLPPVDLPNGVYGLVGYMISQMKPRPTLSVKTRFEDDPLVASFIQAVLRFEISRFALWFGTQETVLANGKPNPRKLYLQACAHECGKLVIDGDYGPATANAVQLMQYAFSDTAYENQQWGKLVADGVVGPQSWPILLRCATKKWS